MTRARETGSYPTTYETSDTPHQNDGDFLSLESVPEPAEERPFPRPIYSNPVREGGVRPTAKPKRDGDVTLVRYEVTMENGAAYDVGVAMSNRADALDIAHLETTALSTQPDGLNMLRMRDLAHFGISTIYQSVQKNPLRCGGVRNSAHDGLEIHTALTERYGFDPTNIMTGGISRGGDRALRAASEAARHGKKARYIDAKVPAPPERIRPVQFLTRLALSLPYEVNEMLHYYQVPLHELAQYHKTPDVLPHKVVQQVREISELLNGQLEQQIRRKLPIDTVGYVVAHHRDMFTDPNAWVRTLARHPHMIVEVSPGAHMSCAGRKDREDWRQRMGAVAEVLGDNTEHRNLGGAAFRALLAEANPVFDVPHLSVVPPLAA